MSPAVYVRRVRFRCNHEDRPEAPGYIGESHPGDHSFILIGTPARGPHDPHPPAGESLILLNLRGFPEKVVEHGVVSGDADIERRGELAIRRSDGYAL